MNLILQRDVFNPLFTLGQLFHNGKRFAYTCEDCDRRLEEGNEKLAGITAIPRGRYKLIVSFSNRFQKNLPLFLNVPGFEGIRIHAGNSAEDSSGCVLIGLVRIANGVAKCGERVDALIHLLEDAEDHGEECWITVK